MFKLLIPVISFKQRVKILKPKKESLEEEKKLQKKEKERVFIWDRRLRRGSKRKKKKIKTKHMTRKRPHIKLKKEKIIYPWVAPRNKLILIAINWLSMYCKQILNKIKMKVNFLFKVSIHLLPLIYSKAKYDFLEFKYKFYRIAYKTRIGLHYRW